VAAVTAHAYDRLLDALHQHGCKVRSNGTSSTAQCPAHDDSHPSLSLRKIDGSVLVCCHAGCPTEDVLAALALQTRDLYDDPKGATYRYDDGRIVHRTPNKRFWQSGNTNGHAVLYRLDRLKTAVEDERLIYVVEGEKDVHAIEAAGGIATCAPMGAGCWDKVDPSPLYGGKITVVADKDTRGYAHARDVLASLDGMVPLIEVVVAREGKDAADHIAAGHDLNDLQPIDLDTVKEITDNEEETDEGPHRQLTLTPASSIHVRPIHWLWHQRIAVGTLVLLGGREGLGKSTVAYGLVADVTRGRLPGAHFGHPRGVIIAATEDSWEHTIVPRLMAADADLDRVFRVDVTTVAGVHTSLSLPRDLPAMKRAVEQVDAAMILLDPLMSRLDSKLDSHKDADVRLALEPLTTLADRCRVAMLGIIHVNKSAQADPVNLLMGSRAFGAVARAVLFVMRDPDDDTQRLLGQPKNNLGRTDLPTLTFAIGAKQVADTEDGPVTASHIVWTGERAQTIHELLESATQDQESRSATAEAADWLTDYLTSKGGCDDSASIKREGNKAGHTVDALKRARRKLRLDVESSGFPRRTTWTLPGSAAQSEQSGGESSLTALTAPTGDQSVQWEQSVQSGETPRANAPTEDDPDQPTLTNDDQEDQP
jgi:hypothetical protein